MSETREQINARKRRERAHRLPELAEKARIARANESPEKRAVRLEKARLNQVKWRQQNPQHEGAKLAKKRWKQNNNGLVIAHTAKRRAAKLQRTPSWLTDIHYERISNEYKLASLLTKITGSPWHVDHIIPLQGKLVSGLHVPSNLRAILGIKNVSKSNTYNDV
jgi:5-methylcytosine-specific restriction endonuclease McrA